MKTTEQIKSEGLNYLNKTSIHLFVKENGEFYKVLVEGDNFIIINGDKSHVYNINDYITWYGVNTKSVIKHVIFLGKKLKSIKNFKSIKEVHSKVKEAIDEKTDKIEISKIVNSVITGTPIITEEKKSFIAKLFGK